MTYAIWLFAFLAGVPQLRAVSLPTRYVVTLLFSCCVMAATSQLASAQSTTAPNRSITYYALTARDLTIEERSTLIEAEPIERQQWTDAQRWRTMEPRVQLDSPRATEVYVIEDLLGASPSRELADIDRFTIVIQTEEPPAEVAGVLLLTDPQNRRIERIRFRADAGLASARHRDTFYTVQSRHYQRLMSQRVPGQAWFRHRAAMADAALKGVLPEFQAAITAPGTDQDMLERSYALFSGGQAVSENLQLDRVIDQANDSKTEPRSIDVESLPGITVAAINWKPLMPSTRPPVDPLAKFIPCDQHAIFFPTFQHAVFVADKVREQGAWLMSAMRDHSQSRGVFEFYQSQLGISLDALSRLIGDRLARSVALTGSDPYYQTGTDVAVLLESDQAALLHSLLLAQMTTVAQQHQLAIGKDSYEGVSFHGFRNTTRSLSSYLAQLGSVVVVTNSPVQLRRLVDVYQGRERSLDALDEYIVFRDRYRVGDAAETAFVFLSDDTIRRWCSPQWRIATARRTRDAAVLAELTARLIDQQVPDLDHLVIPRQSFSQLGSLSRDGEIIHHDSIGNLRFLTPIVELDTGLVTAREKDAYERWRANYQRNWRWAFDPIGMRVTWTPHRVAADLTILPLIASSDYAPLVELSRGAAIAPEDGDPHDAPFHIVLALNKDSEQFRSFANSTRNWGFPHQTDPLAWIDRTVALYVDDDPLWKEWAALSPAERNERFEEFVNRAPVALRADVSNGVHLTAFLVALRAWIEQTTPGMLSWEAFEYNKTPYVRIRPTEVAAGMNRWTREFELFYAATGRSFTISPSETVLKNAIDREVAAIAAAGNTTHDGTKLNDRNVRRPWLGSNLAAQTSSHWIEIWKLIEHDVLEDHMQRQSWEHIPILNEWHKRFPDEDPAAVQQRYWHAAAICPGGGKYVWNDTWQTMESTVYGHPTQPKSGPILPTHLQVFRLADFGLTFEEQGLRARLELSTE